MPKVRDVLTPEQAAAEFKNHKGVTPAFGNLAALQNLLGAKQDNRNQASNIRGVLRKPANAAVKAKFWAKHTDAAKTEKWRVPRDELLTVAKDGGDDGGDYDNLIGIVIAKGNASDAGKTGITLAAAYQRVVELFGGKKAAKKKKKRKRDEDE